MFKIKFYFNLWLFAMTCLFFHAGVTAKELDFSSLSSCKSDTQQYEINYDNVGSLEWIVEGGVIISLDGRDESLTPQQMFTQYMGTQWYTVGNHNVPFSASETYSYTRIKFDGNMRMEARCYVVTGSTPRLFDGSDHARHAPTLISNPLKKITIVWSPNAMKRTITCKGNGLGAIGFLTGESGEVQKTIQLYRAVPGIRFDTYNPDLICTQGIQLNGVPYDNTYYTNTWNVPYGVITNNWNSGIYIDHFTNSGIIPVTVTISNVCGESKTKQINLNVSPPDFGHITQNGNNVDVPGSFVALDCQGNFNIGMPVWVSNNVVYTWELPGIYSDQTNSYTRIIKTGANVQGQLPFGALTDFVGKVTITGICGAVVKTFIVRPALRPTVDMDIYSCSNAVSIKVNNPTGTSAINAWITSTPTGGSASITNPTATSVVFTATKAGVYGVNIGINATNGCYTELQTFVHAGTGGANANNNSSGWQSGVLSDNRQTVGSNIVQYGGKIYFSGRDGKIYFYSYNTALQKWTINQVAGITNAAIPANGVFNKIGLAKIGAVDYLFFTNTGGLIKKINIATNFVDDGLAGSTLSSDFVVETDNVYAINKQTNELLNTNSFPIVVANATLKTIITGYGVSYIQNNNLFIKGNAFAGALTATNDVYSTSDVVYYNGWVYFARGQKGSANVYRLQIANPSGTMEQITTTSNLSGVFTINPVSGVIYYGVLNLGATNNIVTLTSGTYKAADIYQARLQSNVWVVNKATTAVNYEGLDMYIQSPVYSANHLYYIGAGRNAATTGNTGVKELEIWNLYYEDGCAPAVQRVASDPEETAKTEMLLYPNPFNSNLSIDLSSYSENDERTIVAVEVIDATGKSVYKASLLSQLAEIATGDWAPGIYVVKVRYKDTVINKKAVKF